MKKRTSQKQEAAQVTSTRDEVMNTSVEVCSFKVPLPRLNRVSFCTIYSFACVSYALALMRAPTIGSETTNVDHRMNVQTF